MLQIFPLFSSHTTTTFCYFKLHHILNYSNFLFHFRITKMKYFLISSVLIAAVAAASAISFVDLVKEEWHAFKVTNIPFKNE